MSKSLLIIAGLLSVLTTGKTLATYEESLTTDNLQRSSAIVFLAEGGGSQSVKESWAVNEVYTNGSYTGPVIDGKRGGKGKGKMIYNNGDMYEGDWKNDKMEGYGKFIYNNGDIYEGDWKDNKREGHGKYIYSNGNIYEGDWKNDKR
jgi:hypothetical protein